MTDGINYGPPNTELTFLISLLLNHKLPKITKDAIANRLKEVEANLISVPSRPIHPFPAQPFSGVPQAASTMAILARNPDLMVPTQAPVAIVAQTPAAQAALNARQESINLAVSGKPEKGRTSPRKF